MACKHDIELSPFTSDGCSLFPDSSLITKDDWCECCLQHDLTHVKGVTGDEGEVSNVIKIIRVLEHVLCMREVNWISDCLLQY